MPKIEITDSKGLVQKTGSGVELSSKGLEGVVVSSATTLPFAANSSTSISFSMPAGALVTDFGFVVTEGFIEPDNENATKSVKLGTTAGGTELVASSTVVPKHKTVVVGASTSVLSGTLLVADGAALFDFADASVLYSSTARTLHATFVQGAAAASDAGSVVAYVKYIIV